MKSLMFLIALLIVGCAPSAYAGLLDQALTTGWEKKQAHHKYKLNTYGWSVRVYEWTPKDNPKITCVFLAGETNSTGVACYPKKSK